MKTLLLVFSLCSLFALALITVRLKTREVLVSYEIAELEVIEELIFDRIDFDVSDLEHKTSEVFLLNRALEHGIELYLGESEENRISLLEPGEADAHLE